MAKQPYNKIYNEEKWNKVCNYNKRLLDEFLLQLKSELKSSGTIKQYTRNIKAFFIYILDELDNVPISKLKKKAFRNYILYLQDNGCSVATINTNKSAISSMLLFASDDEDFEDDIPVNYVSKLKPLSKDPVRDIVFLPPEYIDLIRNELIKREKYQTCLLFDILTESGIRHNECYQIQKDWIVEGNRKTTCEVIGKRKKKFKVCIHDRTRESYNLYMKQRGEDDIPELWINKDGVAASYDALYYWILDCRKILEELTGEELLFNLHSLRHYFIDGMVKGYHHICKDTGRTFTLQQVQAMVNHSSSETTSQYCNNDESEIVDDAFGWN